jgi:hypothetical protein
MYSEGKGSRDDSLCPPLIPSFHALSMTRDTYSTVYVAFQRLTLNALTPRQKTVEQSSSQVPEIKDFGEPRVLRSSSCLLGGGDLTLINNICRVQLTAISRLSFQELILKEVCYVKAIQTTSGI